MPLPLSALSLATGAALALLGLADMTLAVLHVQDESPITNRLTRTIWRALRGLSAPLGPEWRGHVLTWGVPMMIFGMITYWALTFVTGFALLYLPVIHNAHWFTLQNRAPGLPAVDALYFSGVSFLTIGYGDIAPAAPVVRLLCLVEGATGLLTISLSVTYLVGVFPVISRKVALAALLNQETGGRSDGLLFAQRYLAQRRSDALAERLARLNEDLVGLGLSHSLYPLLFYARPRRAHESFVRVLTVVQGIVTLRYVLDPETHAELLGDPRLATLEEGLLYTLHTMAASTHLAIDVEGPGDAGHGSATAREQVAVEAAEAADTDRVVADFIALCRLADAQGLTPVRRDMGTAIATYARFRRATDPFILAYARSAGYEPEAAWLPVTRTARDTAPIPPAAAVSTADAVLDTAEATPRDLDRAA